MKKTHFVYPYIVPKDPRFGWELMFSIRSIYKFFEGGKGNFDITIVGEKPQWLNTDHPDIKFIPMDNNDPIKYPRVQFRTAQKILAAAELYSDIVVMHDDFYFIRNIFSEEVMIPRFVDSQMDYNNSTEETKRLNMFQKQMRNTSNLLKKLNKPHLTNFASHTPMYFESDKLKELNKIFPIYREYEQNAALIEVAYYNYYGIDGELADNIRAGFWYDISTGDVKTAKILNHDERGFLNNPWILGFLSEHLPTKSPVENW